MKSIQSKNDQKSNVHCSAAAMIENGHWECRQKHTLILLYVQITFCGMVNTHIQI